MSLMERYNETYYVQEFVEKPPSFPPPFDTPIWDYADGRAVVGAFTQSKSDEVRTAEAQDIQTMGLFVTGSHIDTGSVLRRVSDNAYFKIIGEPRVGKSISLPEMRVYSMTLTTRSEEMEREHDE